MHALSLPAARPRWTRRLATVLVVAAVAAVVAQRFMAPQRAAESAPAPAPVSSLSLDQLRSAAQARPMDPKGWVTLGVAATHQAIRTFDPAFSELATDAFDRADGAAGPAGDFRSAVGRGALLLSQHRFADALASGQRALALAPDSPDALGVLVDAEVELGRYDDAARDLQAMLDRKPGLEALSRASYVRELNGDLPGAALAMSQAEAAGVPGSFDVATVIALSGDVAFAGGHAATALSSYERALASAPDLVLAQVGKARALAALGRADEAIPLLRDLTHRVPQPAAVTLLGDLLAARGDMAGATSAYDLVRATFRLQQASGAVTDLEEALFEADHGSAAAALDTAALAYRERPSVYGADTMAWALHRAGRDAEAVPFVALALRLGTADASLHFHAAAVYSGAGDRVRAASELRTALALNPSFSVALAREVRQLASLLGVPIPGAV